MSNKKRIGFFKKIVFWFKSKQETISFISKIQKINELQISKIITLLEGLDQQKLYLCVVKNSHFQGAKLYINLISFIIISCNSSLYLFYDSYYNKLFCHNNYV